MEKLLIAFLSIFTITTMIYFNSEHNSVQQGNEPEVQTDGPYVQYIDDRLQVAYIMQKDSSKEVRKEDVEAGMKDKVSLNVLTDIPGKFFQVRLKKKLRKEKSEYPRIKKLLALSDIEGNFTAFRRLLLANNVIDENFNWTFGNGHLVLVGDFFDRGHEVTEVLWLIYYLEEKAAAAGGHVHFILGNHEIMNLSGDLRYTPQKYLDNAKLLSEDYTSLYNENSELGRWLRTKNIVERIGNVLFMHGGISPLINSMFIPINNINALARPYYADDSFNNNDKKIALLLGDEGPLWYRGYYDKNNAGTSLQLEHTLSQYGVRHIVTGHTIVADTVSVWYNGKLFDLDVHHAGGKSEALLIEDGKYYRVNQEGKKVLLIEE